MRNRQADAAKLFDEPDSATLCFRTEQDAADFARRSVEESNRRYAAADSNILKAYVEGRADIVVPWFSDFTPSKYDFIFSAVVDGVDSINFHRSGSVTNFNVGAPDRHGGQSHMVRVTKLVHGPEGIIPSFVRLETSKERHDFVREVFGSPFDARFQSIEIVGDREVGGFGVDLPSRDCTSVGRLIEDRSKPLKCLDSQMSPGFGEPFGKFEFENFVGLIVRIDLRDQFVWLFLEKDHNLPIKFGNVFIASRESLFGTAK